MTPHASLHKIIPLAPSGSRGSSTVTFVCVLQPSFQPSITTSPVVFQVPAGLSMVTILTPLLLPTLS